jgi:hypothetical protein
LGLLAGTPVGTSLIDGRGVGVMESIFDSDPKADGYFYTSFMCISIKMFQFQLIININWCMYFLST